MFQFPDPFRVYVAVTPLALYLLVVGAAHFRRRPTLVSGARDWLALMLAAAGLLAVGPLELFLPEHAATRFGGVVWLLLVGLYALVMVLAVTGQRPQWVIYQVAPEEALEALQTACREAGEHFVLAGNTLYLPQADIELRIQAGRRWRTAVISAARIPPVEVWRRLETGLAQALARVESPLTWIGPVLVTAALVLWVGAGWRAVENPLAFAKGCREMLRL